MLISNAQFLFIIYLVLFHLNVIGNAIASAKCRQAEYRVGGECCPTCPPGMYVSRHCTEFRSTSCASCTEGTFQDGDNGREQCFACQHCDAGLGLKVKKSCTSTSDAVCEVLDGFFCSDSNRGGCRAAQRHTVCSPGQYIGQRGKADKDTECLHCTDGTFSDGASLSCQNHTKCESVGRVQMKPGTDSTDSECGEHGPHKGLLAGIISGVILASMAASIAIIYWKIKNRGGAAGEGTPGPSSTPLLSTEPATRKQNNKEEEEDRKSAVPTDCPEPTRDQQEHNITISDETMDDQHDDQSPAPPSSPSQDGPVSVSVHQEDHQPVPTKRDHGASQSTRACFTIDGY